MKNKKPYGLNVKGIENALGLYDKKRLLDGLASNLTMYFVMNFSPEELNRKKLKNIIIDNIEEMLDMTESKLKILEKSAQKPSN